MCCPQASGGRMGASSAASPIAGPSERHPSVGGNRRSSAWRRTGCTGCIEGIEPVSPPHPSSRCRPADSAGEPARTIRSIIQRLRIRLRPGFREGSPGEARTHWEESVRRPGTAYSAYPQTRSRTLLDAAGNAFPATVEGSGRTISIRARLETGFYDEPTVKARIVGALMDSLWLQ
jgi:hypothetical protein